MRKFLLIILIFFAGDKANATSGAENNTEDKQVNISEATFILVRKNLEIAFTSRDKFQAKGQGELELYFESSI